MTLVTHLCGANFRWLNPIISIIVSICFTPNWHVSPTLNQVDHFETKPEKFSLQTTNHKSLVWLITDRFSPSPGDISSFSGLISCRDLPGLLGYHHQLLAKIKISVAEMVADVTSYPLGFELSFTRGWATFTALGYPHDFFGFMCSLYVTAFANHRYQGECIPLRWIPQKNSPDHSSMGISGS